MRVGQNPAKSMQSVSKPERITIAVLSYIPFIGGYYAESLEVLKICLNSIKTNTKLSHDLLVFDNGSCEEVKDYLFRQNKNGLIQYLLLSQNNLGKGGAWNFIFDGSPGEIIAYCDSDALFYPGWLSKSIEILETFPKVGMVTARPMRTDQALFSKTLEWAERQKGVKVEKGQLISFEEFCEFAQTMGYSERKIQNIYKTTIDHRLTYKGVTAYAGANHFQFIGWKKILKTILPFNLQKPIGQVKELDIKLNKREFLRLMTAEPLVQNMSNRVPVGVSQRINNQRESKMDKKFSLKNVPILKKILLSIHHRIFRLYYDD